MKNLTSKELKTKIALIANIPAPYREKVYSLIDSKKFIELNVYYCQRLEKGRKWKLKNSNYNSFFLNSYTLNFGQETHIHLNLKIFKILKEFKPDVVITNGFALPMVLAFLFSLIYNKKHISFIDGTVLTEKKLSFFHKLLRKFIFKNSDTFIGPSNETKNLYKSYNIDDKKIFKSCLAVDNKKFINQVKSFNRKKYDLLFSGQFIDRKCPLFFVEIVKQLSKIRKNLKVVVIGSGPLEKLFIKNLKKTNAEIHFKGFVDQEDLPLIYSNSKIFVMPTKEDCWGVVANEALASGCPVITTPYAGIANELIIHNVTGYVIHLDSVEWIKKIDLLLENKKLYKKMSVNGIKLIKNYNYIAAANGILDAIEYSQNEG